MHHVLRRALAEPYASRVARPFEPVVPLENDGLRVLCDSGWGSRAVGVDDQANDLVVADAEVAGEDDPVGCVGRSRLPSNVRGDAWSEAHARVCEIHHCAICSRVANQTSGNFFAYAMKSSTALTRPGRPTMRQCNPTDIILGWSAASAYSTSKLSHKYVRNWLAGASPLPSQNWMSFVSGEYGTTRCCKAPMETK